MWKPHLLPPYGAYRGALHGSLSIPSGLCLPKNVRTHAHPVSRTIVRIECVVMSFPSAPFSHNRFLLRWLLVYTCKVCASCEALDLIGTIVTYYFFPHPLGLRSCLRSEYLLYKLI
jgi:hypothetical protein